MGIELKPMLVGESRREVSQVSTQLQQAKHPASPMLAGPYGHPFHPILVTVPIGSWVASLIFDISSHIVDRPGFLTQGSEWLIGIGVLGAVLAAGVGLLDLFMIPTRTPAFRVGLLHMSLNLAVTAAYIGGFAWRHGSYTHDQPVSGGQIALSAVSLAVLAVSGYLGGKLAYHYGVRVADEATQVTGYTTAPRTRHEADERAARPARR